MEKAHINFKKNKLPKKRQFSKIRRKDPYFERECERYNYPLPSREYIISLLKESDEPLSPDSLAQHLEISTSEAKDFSRRINAMLKSGQLLLNRKNLLIVPDEVGLQQGRVLAHRDGFGFFIPEIAGQEDLYLSPREMSKVLDGDIVLVRRRPDPGRSSATIVEIIKHAHRNIVGRLLKDQGIWFLIPENPVLPKMIITAKSLKIRPKPKSGDIVETHVIEYPSSENNAIVEIKQKLGDPDDPEIEMDVAIRRYDLPFEFSKAVEKLANSRAKPVKPKALKNRVDLRDLALITIDGKTAKDFDDAVYAERVKYGFRLIVAIADVSHYVTPGDELDKEAETRGNSVYFPTRVLPMLPEALSNDICSLVPNEDRLAMVCDMDLTETGTIKSYKFYPAVIRSKARLTYEQVYAQLYTDETDLALTPAITKSLFHLKTLYQALIKLRLERGSVDFEIPETQIIFTDDKKIEKIVPTERNDAHKLIEECMLAANICAANFLIEHHQAGIYRVHDTPKHDKLEELRNHLKRFNLSLAGGDTPAPADFVKLIQEIHKRPGLDWLQMLVLRALPQAVYQALPNQHFALAYPVYTHFTSPIRRYPDLIVHRMIKAVLNKTPNTLSAEELQPVAAHCSMTERRADQATRDATAWLKCDYMRNKIGNVYEGSITHLNGMGIFVLLDDIYVEGLVHIAELGNDYFQFEPEQHRIVGKRNGFVYQIGNRIRVQVASVNVPRRQIDFVLAKNSPAQQKALSSEGDASPRNAKKKFGASAYQRSERNRSSASLRERRTAKAAQRQRRSKKKR